MVRKKNSSCPHPANLLEWITGKLLEWRQQLGIVCNCCIFISRLLSVFGHKSSNFICFATKGECKSGLGFFFFFGGMTYSSSKDIIKCVKF